MKNWKRHSIITILVGTAAIAATLRFGTVAAKADNPHAAMFTVDVAVDHETFAIIPSTGLVLHPEALGPNRGTSFIVDGKIFRGGTLQKGLGMGDPNQPGSIGSWNCKGIFTSDLGTRTSASIRPRCSSSKAMLMRSGQKGLRRDLARRV